MEKHFINIIFYISFRHGVHVVSCFMRGILEHSDPDCTVYTASHNCDCKSFTITGLSLDNWYMAGKG